MHNKFNVFHYEYYSHPLRQQILIHLIPVLDLLRCAFFLGRLRTAISGSVEVEQVGDECRQGAAVFPECNAPIDWSAEVGHEPDDVASVHLVLLVIGQIVLDELTDRLDRKVR